MIQRLKTRRQFLRVAAENRKWAAPGIVLQAAPQPSDDRTGDNGPRYGLTVSKRVGNAVTRNRARRRLRAVAEEILPTIASTEYDYVLIGRKGTPSRDFSALRKDLKTGLEKLGALRELNNDNDAPDRAH
ncbi:MAG: ribonuclease P protein component [Alphaproteobacteria bacterium]|jgi:ribonuclease P protein component|nr:ribonuclease P protein component [Alphaproteobacteria bacterium]